MTDIEWDQVEAALLKREKFIMDNLETLTSKKLRKTLEEDLGLPEQSLSVFKSEIRDKLDEVLRPKDDTPKADKKNAEGGGPQKSPKNAKPDSSKPAVKDKGNKKSKPQSKPIRKKTRDENSAEDDLDDDLDEVNDSEVSNNSEADSDSKKKSMGKKRKAVKTPKEKSKPTAKKARKSTATSVTQSGGKVVSAYCDKLKQILREATISVPPNLYKANRDEDSLSTALTDLLQKNGLSPNSDSRTIARVKKNLQKMRDMDGIDTTNIIVRRPRRAAAQAAMDYVREGLSDRSKKVKESDDESSDESEGGSERSDSGGSEKEKENPKGNGKLKKRTLNDMEESESGKDDACDDPEDDLDDPEESSGGSKKKRKLSIDSESDDDDDNDNDNDDDNDDDNQKSDQGAEADGPESDAGDGSDDDAGDDDDDFSAGSGSA